MLRSTVPKMVGASVASVFSCNRVENEYIVVSDERRNKTLISHKLMARSFEGILTAKLLLVSYSFEVNILFLRLGS